MFSSQPAAVSEDKSTVPISRARWSAASVWSRLEARRRTVAAVTLLIAVIPALFAAYWVQRYGVGVPMKDDWDTAGLIIDAHHGRLKWSDIFQQQQEARYVLPKLLMIATTFRGVWDPRDLMWLSIAVCLLTALGLYWLLGKSGLPPALRAVCFWLIALVVFSAAQFELWPWASGFPLFLLPFFLVVALCLLETSWPVAAKFGGCLILATAASFTLPLGLLLWGLTFPLLFLRGELRMPWRWCMAWLGAAALCAGIYFHGYARPAQLPEFAPRAISLFEYAQYFFAFLGGELAYATQEGRIALAGVVGAVFFAAYLAAILYAIARRSDKGLIRRALPWFALGAYSIGAASLCALGRIGFGLGSAISSRYVAFSLYLSVAIIALVPILGKEIGKAQRSTRVHGIFYAICLLFCGLFLALFSFATGRSLRLMEGISTRTRLGHAGLLFGQVLDTSQVVTKALYFDSQWLAEKAAALDDLKLLRPPLLRDMHLASLPHAEEDNRSAAGEWTALVPGPNESLLASGWAIFKQKGRRADAVVLTYETPQGGTVFALSDELACTADLSPPFRRKRYGRAKWCVAFSRTALPENARISAWAVDAEAPKLYRLKQTAPELPR